MIWQNFLQQQPKAINPAANTALSLLPLVDKGLLKIAGEDAQKFLQGQLTCELRQAGAYLGFGGHCKLNGRLEFIAELYFVAAEQAYYLALPQAILAYAKKALEKYALFSKVKLTLSDYVGVGLLGASAAALVDKRLTPEHALLRYQHANYPERVALYGPVTEMIDLWPLLAANAQVLSSDYWKLADFQHKIPSIYPETIDKFLPHHLNLLELGAINFKKGCYVGQEIIARMHYRGKIKKHLYRYQVITSTPLALYQALYSVEGQEIGHIVDFVALEPQHYALLAVIDEIHHQQVFLQPGQGPLQWQG